MINIFDDYELNVIVVFVLIFYEKYFGLYEFWKEKGY